MNSLSKALEDLAKDRSSGASLLAQKAADYALLFLKQTSPLSKEQLTLFATTLRKIQPSMAPLIHLSQLLLNSPPDRKILIEKITNWKTEIRSSDQQIAKQTLSLFQKPATLLTHSYSSTVEKALNQLHSSNKLQEVILTESLPGGEGTLFFKHLQEKNFPARLIPDKQAIQKLNQCDALLLGADAYTEKFVINKVGSASLAEAAYKKNIPCFILTGRYKFVEDTPPLTSLFEAIPIKYITKIIYD